MRQIFQRPFFIVSTRKLYSFTLQPQESLKLLIYLTCKYIVHYACIDNLCKLCPICPSTDEIDVDVDDNDVNVNDDVNMDKDGDGEEEESSQPEI